MLESETDAQVYSNRQIARAAGTVMIAIMLGQLTGLLRGILVARAFAPSDLDAFFAANRVSETLFNLIAAGALGSAFIPTFTGLHAKGEEARAWRLASSLANLIFLILTGLSVLAGVFAPQIVRDLLAPGFASDPVQFALTVQMLRIQLASVILFGLGALLVGILNAHQIFFIPALTPSMYQLGLIFGVLVLGPRLGIRGLAWGVVIGSSLYLLLQVPAIVRLMVSVSQRASRDLPGDRGGTYSLTLGRGDPAVREVLTLMLPRVLGIGVVQLNFWVNTWLASQMVAGSVAAIQYGFSLMLMSEAAIAQSVAIAAMPTFSAQHALGKLDELRSSLTASLRGVLLLAAPASLGLVLLREPIVALLYQRGEFDAQMTTMVSWALLWYALGLVGHSMLEVLTRAFYAQHDTRTPVFVGVGAMTLNVILSFVLSGWFARLGLVPLGGLALANSCATALEMLTLFFIMRSRLGGLHSGRVAGGLLQAAAGTLAMGLVLALWLHRSASGLLLAVGGVALGFLVYAAMMWALRVPELRSVYRGLRRRLASARTGI